MTMSSVGQDLRFAFRSLRRHWVAGLVSVVSLAVAIGGNTAVFSMLDAFILRPLPYPEADRIVIVGEPRTDRPAVAPTYLSSLPTWADLTEQSRTVSSWGAYRGRTVTVRGADRAVPVRGAEASASLFEVLGGRAVRGRTFRPDETVEGGPDRVIVSHEYWIDRWGVENEPVGEVLVIDGRPHEVVGVLPPDFAFLGASTDLWLPLKENPRSASRNARDVITLGRMAASATMEQVREEVAAVNERLADEHPEAFRDRALALYSLRDDFPPTQTRLLFALLQGAVVAVLLIACLNMTNLLLARSRQRRGEIALRSVLGAGRGRIVRQLVTESGLLVVLGATAGLALGAVGVDLIQRQFAGLLPPSFNVTLDSRVLVFTAVIAVVAGLTFGLLPIIEPLRTDHAQTLGRSMGRGGSRGGLKVVTRTLVVAEIALSFVALGGGSLLVRSMVELRAVDTDFDQRAVLTTSVRVPGTKYPEDEARRRLFTDVVERAGRLPGVDDVALTSALPMGGASAQDTFRVEGATDEGESSRPPEATVVYTSPGYAEVFRTEVVQGRFLQPEDATGFTGVVVVSRSLADAHFPDRRPVGETIRLRGDRYRVIGVVADVPQTVAQVGSASASETLFLPWETSPRATASLALSTSVPSADVAESLRAALRGIDADLATGSMLTMEEYVGQFFGGVSVFNTILVGFGIVALLLAALGTYGVLAQGVSQRRKEIGIRMAVGADHADVVRMVARGGLGLGVLGLGLGVLLTLPVVRVLQSLMQGIAGTIRPSTLVAIAGVLFAATLGASVIPARQAASLDPVQTLRED